jgi:hypothetical protein
MIKEVISPASSTHPNSKVGSIRRGELSPGSRSAPDSVPEQHPGTLSRHSQEPDPDLTPGEE